MAKPIIEPANRPKWVAWLALFLAVALIAGLVGLAVAIVADAWSVMGAMRRGVPPAGSWLNLALTGLGVIVALCVSVMYGVDRMQKPADDADVQRRIADGAMFFLYLRPFAIERRLLLELPLVSGIPYLWALPPIRYLLGLEPNLKRAMEEVGAVMVGIGELDRSPGVAKLTPGDADWQQVFVDLAERASGIFVIPFTSAGSQWEFDWLLEKALGKTIIVLPPVHADPIVGELRTHAFEAQWQLLRGRYAGRIDLPAYEPRGLMVTLKPGAGRDGAGWVPDVSFPLDRIDLKRAVEHLLRAGRLGGLIER